MFIDPASKSTGWALFKGPVFQKSGTITADATAQVFDRLRKIGHDYGELGRQIGVVHEVHIEQLVRTTHIYTHWSVGVIGAATVWYSGSVAGDLSIKAWQSHVDWDGRRQVLDKFDVDSEDELAAIGMGIFYTESKG